MTAEGQNLLLANISTSRASLLQASLLQAALLVEILANKFCPSAVVPALQYIWFYRNINKICGASPLCCILCLDVVALKLLSC